MVALPPAGDVNVRGFPLESATLDGVELAPVPVLERGPQGVTARYRRTPEAYAARPAGAGDRAKLLGVGWLRNQRVARIAIRSGDCRVPAIWPIDWRN